MVRFVDDIFLSEVWISEVFRPLFVSCVLLGLYGLIQVPSLNTIHSRHYKTHQMPHFFWICAFSERPPKAFPAWLMPPNELMVDPPDDPLVTMAEIEAFVLDFYMVSSNIVASSADFLIFFLFYSTWSGQPLYWVLELPILRLSALRALQISSQWCLTKSLNHFVLRYVPLNNNPLLS